MDSIWLPLATASILGQAPSVVFRRFYSTAYRPRQTDPFTIEKPSSAVRQLEASENNIDYDAAH